MQIGIYGSAANDSAAKSIKKILDDVGITSFAITSKTKMKPIDCVIVLGGDAESTHPTTPPRGGKRSKSAKVAKSGEAVDVESVAAGDGADDVVVL